MSVIPSQDPRRGGLMSVIPSQDLQVRVNVVIPSQDPRVRVNVVNVLIRRPWPRGVRINVVILSRRCTSPVCLMSVMCSAVGPGPGCEGR